MKMKMISLLKQYNYHVTLGKEPKVGALNVIIENFSAPTSQKLIEFCQAHKKSVAIIMTEHLDYEENTIKIHGNPLWTENDYMPAQTQAARIQYLIECMPYIRCFFTLGDLPKLLNFDEVLPSIPIIKLEFPAIKKVSTQKPKHELKNDLLFTGFLTSYRRSVISMLRQNNLNLYYPQELVSKKVRASLCKSAKINLNIPQRSDWPWLSLMRVIAALQLGKATVSLGTKDTSKISLCCYQLDINENTYHALAEYINNWEKIYEDCFNAYNMMAAKYAAHNPFPHYLFEYWSLTDKHLINKRKSLLEHHER